MTIYQRICELQAEAYFADWFKSNPKHLRLSLARGLHKWAQNQIEPCITDLMLGEVFRQYGHCLLANSAEFEVIALTYGTGKHPYVVGWVESSKGIERDKACYFPPFAQLMYLDGWDRGRNDLECNTDERYRQ